MAVTDAEFRALVRRVNDLEDTNAGQRLKHQRELIDEQAETIAALRADLDNAHAAFVALRAEFDALCDRVETLEAESVPDPTLAAA